MGNSSGDSAIASCYDKEKARNTIIINLSNSRCGNCGEGALPEQRVHDIAYGYSAKYPRNGCGTDFRYVSTDYIGTWVRFGGGSTTSQIFAEKYPHLEWNGFDDIVAEGQL